jgi:hypothetical protein
MTTFAKAADIFNAAHPEGDPDVAPCTTFEHVWSEWEFNYHNDCEIRLCARCGVMEQQWIAADR